MPSYSYQALASTGETVTGDLYAENEPSALDALVQKGLTPLDLRPAEENIPWWNRDIRFFGSSPSVREKDIENFFSAFSTLLDARIPLSRALAFCKRQTRNRRLRRAVADMETRVEGGETLAAAMRSVSPAFSERLSDLIAMGEAANRLPQVTRDIAAFLSSEAKLRGELRSALIYPVLLLIMSAAVVSLVIFYLAPTLLPVFSSAGVAPPVTLQVMSAIRTVLLDGWVIILVVFLFLGALFTAFRSPLTVMLGRVSLRLPGLGVFLRQKESLRALRTLGMMLTSGTPLPTALGNARDICRSQQFKALFAQCRKEIESGGKLSTALSESWLVDDMVKILIQTGEESDRLPSAVAKAADHLSQSSSATLARAMQMITPVLTLAIGLGVGGIILSTISAIMDMNDIAF
ncbi:MAG: type II secretion system F family protein [Albidovulum sp.]|uniref:type II secretion system F family protein n=1 Tax=Albidovulum sp. TaxID=1872424 RepID=UPI003CA68880